VELAKVVGHDALNTFTNDLKSGFETAIAFPAAAPRAAA